MMSASKTIAFQTDQPVRHNVRVFGDGKPGPMWRKIISRWSEIVEKDIYREMVGE